MYCMQVERRKTTNVRIADGVYIGSDYPIMVQSMTNTLTADVETTAKQVKELYLAGSTAVRLTVNDEDAAKAIPLIDAKLKSEGLTIPLVGDFHYNGHLLLTKYPECAKTLAKYRINPGNVGYGDKHDYNFGTMIKVAIEHDKPVRIGVNWGSLDQDLFTEMMDDNAKQTKPLSFKDVLYNAMVESALRSAKLAEELGLAHDKIIISVKMSEVQDLINVYKLIADKCDYPLHLGLTEAGTAIKGMIASSAAMGILLQQGIGDTIRMSLTPSADESGSGRNPLADRALEVRACQHLLQAMDLEFFKPTVTSCPGCGRTSSTYFQTLAEEVNQYIEDQINEWRPKHPGVEKLKIAVMGCIVNGPGESKYADIGISLPGNNEEPSAPVYIDGEHHSTLKGDKIGEEFREILENYIQKRFAGDDSRLLAK